MSTIGQTDSRPRRLNLRAFLAGGGATLALVGAAVVAFIGIGALVAFDELPFGGGDDGASVVEIGSAETGDSVAAILGDAADPVSPARAAARAASAPAGASEAPSAGTPPPASPGQPQGAPVPSAIGTGPGPDGGGTLGDTIRGAEDDARDAGADVPLSELTDDATRPLDEAVGGIGGGLDQPGPR
jgi:hypothetical protein